MASLGGFIALVYVACVIALILYVLRLLSRFASPHERMANPAARKLRDETTP